MICTFQYKECIYDNREFREQLLDVNTDLGETANGAVDEACRAQLIQDRQLLREWAHETNDVTFPYIKSKDRAEPSR